jgi:hypothetical protein
MIRNFAPRLCALLLITLPIAILIVSIASVPLAQMTGAGQPSGKHPNVSMPPSLGTAKFGSLPGTRPHAKELGVPAMEQGDPIFLPAVTYGAGGDTSSMAVADVNGDGKFDVAVTTYNSHGVGVLLGNGDGTFQPVHIYSPGSTYPSSIAITDVNGDGKPDLVVANEVDPTYFSQEEGVVGVLLGNGDGTFQPTLTYSAGGRGATSIAIADVNTDGKPDLVVAIAVSDQVGILLGNGDGTFQPAVTYPSGGFGAVSVASADVNGDGKPDALIANALFCDNNYCGAGVVGVLLNNIADTTRPVITLSATPKSLWPPNGRMVPVRISGSITDTGSGVNASTAAYAVKDEYGEVQPKGAINLGPRGSYSFTVLLQASRLGSDLDGRRYTVIVRAEDNTANRGSKRSAVTVPHDQKH